MSDVDDKATSECAVCSTDIDVDNVIHTEYDSIVCDDCVQICQRCDTIGTIDDCFMTVDDETWCEACADRRSYFCDSCEERNSYGTSYVSDRGEHWCEGCLNDTYWCDDCEEYNAEGCDRCSEDTDSHGNRVIHDYSYRPDAIFHSTDKNERLFFGLEIEVEGWDSKSDSAMHAYQLESMDLAYLKNDGSLNNGFEIVTHPMSHDFFKNEASDFWSVIEDLRSKNGVRVKSWDTRTCGLHIHISRTGFNGGAHMHRFLNLVYSNPDFYSTLAGRSSDQWAKFTDIYMREYKRDENGERIWNEDTGYDITSKRTFMHKLQPDRNSDRYSAVNTNNRETLEMRIFRGTVNGETIKAQLDLAHASVEYTRNLTVQDVRNGNLSADRFMFYIIDNCELYPELHSRINKLILPNYVGLARQEVSI
jgi:hypothetical protein